MHSNVIKALFQFRDRNNGWIQIGEHRTARGTFHRESHGGAAATWGETNDNRPFKGHMFCCLT